jgi:hypothetical protein
LSHNFCYSETGGHPRTMGGSNSTEIGGVRVFKVCPASPASEAGLEVFFDFILEINGVKMDPSGQQQFAKVISDAENGSAKLQVFNTRSNTAREVIVNPRKWAGTGLLGATVRYDVTDPADNHGIRVLEVFPNSPAAHAGLVPFQDYLLGTAQSVFHDIDELVEVVSASINQRMQVYVYNTDAESVREVTLVPNTEWGGDGCIGCDIGTGLLHRIPAPRRMPGGMSPMSPVAVPGMPGQPQWAPQPGMLQPMYPPGMQVPVPVVPQLPVQPGTVPPQMMPGVLPAAVQQQTAPTLVAPQIPQLQPQMPPQVAHSPVAAAPQAMPTMPAGMPAIATTGMWPPQQIPGAYQYAAPPGTIPQYAAPAPIVPTMPAYAAPAPAIPTMPQATAAPTLPQIAPQTAPAPAPAVVEPALAPVPAPAPAPQLPLQGTMSQSEELQALQARIQQLGQAGLPMSQPVAAPSAVSGIQWPPQPQQQQVAGIAWPPQQPAQEAPESPPASTMNIPIEEKEPVTPYMAASEGSKAPPPTPLAGMNDVPATLDFSKAMDPAQFAGGPSVADASPPSGSPNSVGATPQLGVPIPNAAALL